MVAWERRPGNPIGPLLVLSGALWVLGRLQGAAWPPLALAANLGNSFAQVVLLAVLVAFPSGRITSRAGWVIVAFGLVGVVGVNLIQVMSIETRTTPGLEGPNPLFVPMDPSVRTALLGIAQVAILAGELAVIGWLLVRWWRATGPARRTFLPIFLAGVGIATLVFVSELLLGGGALSTADRQLVVTVEIMSFALLPAGIVIGVMRDRMARGAVADLVVELGDMPAPGRLRDALAGALGDPSLTIAQWSDTRQAYVDADGAPVELPAAPNGQAVTLLERDGRPLAAIIHDPALADDPGLVASVGTAVRLAVENERLTEEVRSQLTEVRESRARIVEAGDAERRRVERNLHDGAQQRLVALSLALRRARAQLPADAAPETASTLDEAAEQLKTALAELRSLARGIHPAILTEAGLAPALRALARDANVPVEATIEVGERLPDAVEAAAYFVAAEALTNVQKYAGAREVRLTAVADTDRLRLAVSDDGVGGADPSAGSGLRGLADRLAAIGGELEIDSPPGGGTRVSVSIPIAGAQPAS
jgi:signal transduction histidine kinase